MTTSSSSENDVRPVTISPGGGRCDALSNTAQGSASLDSGLHVTHEVALSRQTGGWRVRTLDNVAGSPSTLRRHGVLAALVAAILLVSCTASGDNGVRPPLLSSTVPSASAEKFGNRHLRIAVICAGHGTPTTLPMVVPLVVGLSLQEAAQTLVCEGYRLGVKPPDSSTVGVVLSQSPPAGTPSRPDRTVTISFARRA
jgi:hypothetical protein